MDTTLENRARIAEPTKATCEQTTIRNGTYTRCPRCSPIGYSQTSARHRKDATDMWDDFLLAEVLAYAEAGR